MLDYTADRGRRLHAIHICLYESKRRIDGYSGRRYTEVDITIVSLF